MTELVQIQWPLVKIFPWSYSPLTVLASLITDSLFLSPVTSIAIF
jgi:hypothetical protein